MLLFSSAHSMYSLSFFSTYSPRGWRSRQHLWASGGSVLNHDVPKEGGGVGYRELSRIHVREVVRRWQAQESQRAIARAMALSRVTVRRYITEAQSLALAQTGPPQSWGTAHWTVWPTPRIST